MSEKWEILKLKQKIEERDECIKNLVTKINRIEQSVNNLKKQDKVVILDRHTQSLSPNQGETTTSGNGESSKAHVSKLAKVVEDVSERSEPPQVNHLGKIDRIISDWNRKMVDFDKQHTEIKTGKTKLKQYNPPSSRLGGSIIDDY